MKNVDLWQRLDAALGQHKIKWEWVRATPAILKMNAATSWRAAASHPTLDDVGYLPES